jgi:hypothetical protein
MKLTKRLLVTMLSLVTAFALAVPGLALAADSEAAPEESLIVNVKYVVGTAGYSVDVDLYDLTIDDALYGYLFQRTDVNNVVATNSTVLLQDVLAYAAEQNGFTLDHIWTSGDKLLFTTDGSVPYQKYDAFTYDNLTAQGYWDPNETRTSTPSYDLNYPVPTVLALNTASSEIAAGDTSEEALDALSYNLDAKQAPRLLYGYPQASSFDVGGNRFPSNIDGIIVTDSI